VSARLTPDEVRELRRLNVRLGRRVDSLFSGDYRSAVRGRGMEFEEVRPYVPGDDVRHLDWNVTARSGQPFIKVFREERQNTLILAVDVSGSSRVGSGGRDGRTDRRLQMARIAGGMAHAGVHNRDRVGLVLFSDRVEGFLPPRPTRNHAWAVIQAVFESEAAHRRTDLTVALGHLSRVQPRRAVIVLIGDFLDDGPWARPLATLCRRHEVHAIVVHDPLDHGVAGLGLVEVVDAETGESYLVDGAHWAASHGVEARVDALRKCGARAVAIGTSDDPYTALHLHFQRLGGRR
jgi:uncharacterized protein (DUF58 family)